MYIKDGKKIALATGMVFGDVQIVLPLSAEQLAALGITEVPDQSRPDDRYYSVTENDDGTFKAVPKDLAGLKADVIARNKTACNNLLAASDWQVTRLVERQIPIDADTVTYRAAVLAAAAAGEILVNKCKNVAALAAVVYEWPK